MLVADGRAASHDVDAMGMIPMLASGCDEWSLDHKYSSFELLVRSGRSMREGRRFVHNSSAPAIWGHLLGPSSEWHESIRSNVVRKCVLSIHESVLVNTTCFGQSQPKGAYVCSI